MSGATRREISSYPHDHPRGRYVEIVVVDKLEHSSEIVIVRAHEPLIMWQDDFWGFANLCLLNGASSSGTEWTFHDSRPHAVKCFLPKPGYFIGGCEIFEGLEAAPLLR